MVLLHSLVGDQQRHEFKTIVVETLLPYSYDPKAAAAGCNGSRKRDAG